MTGVTREKAHWGICRQVLRGHRREVPPLRVPRWPGAGVLLAVLVGGAAVVGVMHRTAPAPLLFLVLNAAAVYGVWPYIVRGGRRAEPRAHRR